MDAAEMVREGLAVPARFTHQQYWQMIEAGVLGEDDRVELLEGVVVEMSPQEIPHAFAVSQLVSLLTLGLSPDRWSVRGQLPLTLPGDSEPEPDVAVVEREHERTCPRHPSEVALVVEVAWASLRRDRILKGRIYARAGIPEYWILDVERQSLEVYSEPGPEGYAGHQTYGRDDRVRPALPGAPEIPVAALFR